MFPNTYMHNIGEPDEEYKILDIEANRLMMQA